MRQIDEIIVHCSATPVNWMSGRSIAEKTAEIKRWHTQQRGWRDIGYAVLIDRDGSIAYGRDLDDDGDTFDDIGAHTKGRNSRSVGVCLIGGHGSNEKDKFEDNFTPEQDVALRRVIEDINLYVGKQLPVNGHNQYAAKACPGFHAPTWYARQRSAPTSRPVSTTRNTPRPTRRPSLFRRIRDRFRRSR